MIPAGSHVEYVQSGTTRRGRVVLHSPAFGTVPGVLVVTQDGSSGSQFNIPDSPVTVLAAAPVQAGGSFDPAPLQAQLAALEARVTVLEGQAPADTSVLEARVDGVESGLDGLTSRVTALEDAPAPTAAWPSGPVTIASFTCPAVDPPDEEPPPLSGGDAIRPYDVASPWNTPIGPDPTVIAQSGTYMNAVADNGLPLTCDPDQYTIPVVNATAATPLVTVTGDGFFSSYLAGDNSRVGGGSPWSQQVPIPSSAPIGVGSDGQLEVVNWETGEQWGFWQLQRQANGTYTASNGYRYKITPGNYGRFADGLAGRGAGTPYLAGLVRRWEVEQGHIDHALAFAYHAPAGTFVYPASKSDGANFGGVGGVDMPEGSRLQLDPAFDVTQLQHPMARLIARALQDYGAYCIDNSGSSKLYVEDRRTAGWDASVTRDIVSAIPWSAFRIVAPPA
jgi:hypothetical protein